MRTALRKLAAVSAITLVSTFGIAAGGATAASADPLRPVHESVKPVDYPVCYINTDNLGNRHEVCIDSVTTQPAAAPQVGTFVTAVGHVTECVLGLCTAPQRFTVNKTGLGANDDDVVPSVTKTGEVPVACVGVGSGGTCTQVTVPVYHIQLLPSPGPLATICANGTCTNTPDSLAAIEFNSGNGLALLGLYSK